MADVPKKGGWDLNDSKNPASNENGKGGNSGKGGK